MKIGYYSCLNEYKKFCEHERSMSAAIYRIETSFHVEHPGVN